jgi:hypothetical protein
VGADGEQPMVVARQRGSGEPVDQRRPGDRPAYHRRRDRPVERDHRVARRPLERGRAPRVLQGEPFESDVGDALRELDGPFLGVDVKQE